MLDEAQAQEVFDGPGGAPGLYGVRPAAGKIRFDRLAQGMVHQPGIQMG